MAGNLREAALLNLHIRLHALLGVCKGGDRAVGGKDHLVLRLREWNGQESDRAEDVVRIWADDQNLRGAECRVVVSWIAPHSHVTGGVVHQQTLTRRDLREIDLADFLPGAGAVQVLLEWPR